MKNFFLFTILFICFFTFDNGFFQGGAANAADLPAFPGAVGFGSTTVGGRGGRLMEVTNLNDSGSGSFRAACEASGARIIVFRTGGNIKLSSIIKIKNPFITIAGQSAPGDGISIRGAGITIMTHDVVVRSLRIRIGDDSSGPSPGNRDGIQIQNEKDPPYNIVLDHCSISWAIDETLTLSYAGLRDVTISNTIISEGLYDSIHPDGMHSMGALVTPQGIDNIAFIRNLFIHNDQRNPKMRCTSGALINNVMYNSGYKVVDIESSSKAQSISIVGNLFLKGEDTNISKKPIYIRDGLISGSKIYISDNDGSDYTSENQYEYYTKFNPVVDVLQKWPSGVTAIPKEEVLALILENVGAYPARRDSVDARLINDLRNRTGQIIDSQNDVGGWPDLDKGIPPKDTDQDGMPDSWENDHGLNPNQSSDGNGDRDGDGYTNVEEYLNGLIVSDQTQSPAPGLPTIPKDLEIIP